MHELSIALSIIDIAAAEAESRGAQVVAVHVKIGALSGLVPEALSTAYELACENSPVAGAKLVIEEVPVVIYCAACQSEQTLPSLQEFCCPQCGEFTANVVRGQELEVTALELKT